MQGAVDITYWNLALGYLLLFIPLAVFGYYKTGLVKDTVIAFLRMTVQLFLVGIYIKWIFEQNSTLINILWAVLMIIISSLTIGKRTKMQKSIFIVPFFISVFLTILIIDSYFFLVVIKLKNVFDAHYFVPITGMILGNFLRSNIIALNSFYTSVQKEQTLYRFILANGGTRQEALNPFIREALKISFNPFIANTAVTGLIALPGMMTGQLLGGSIPLVAIKYQIIIMITIFVGSVLSVVFTFLILNPFIFDEYDRLKEKFFMKKGGRKVLN